MLLLVGYSASDCWPTHFTVGLHYGVKTDHENVILRAEQSEIFDGIYKLVL